MTRPETRAAPRCTCADSWALPCMACEPERGEYLYEPIIRWAREYPGYVDPHR